jgi:nuclear inhibitor of protein phosphatase 1
LIAHGTYIGSLRLEGHKPQQVFIDSEIRFGASTRTYIIRERPQINKQFPSMLTSQSSSTNGDDSGPDGSFSHDKDDLNNSSLSMLPESEAELDVIIDIFLKF